MSTPNTRTQPYLSVFNTSGDCKSSKEAIDTKCKKKGKGEEKPNTWLTENCKGLMDKPTGPNIAAIGKYFKNVDKMTPGPAPNTMASAATYQEGLANSNPCIQARRCKLVPFKETSPASTAKEGGLDVVRGKRGITCCQKRCLRIAMTRRTTAIATIPECIMTVLPSVPKARTIPTVRMGKFILRWIYA